MAHSQRKVASCRGGSLLIAISLFAPGAAVTGGPAFDCGHVAAGAIEEMIRGDEGLTLLDRQLADVYAKISRKAVEEHPPDFKSEQHGCLKWRNDCWKSIDRRSCVAMSYPLRIAELQARYRPVPGRGPFSYICDDSLPVRSWLCFSRPNHRH